MAIIPRSMRLPTLIGLASAMLLGQPAVSETIGKRLAVLEFKGSGIKDAVLENFGDEVRGGAVAGLVGRGVLVMTRESMMVLLKEMGKKDCTEGDCEVETARNIGADFVVAGSVVKIDGAFVVTLKLFDVHSAGVLATDRVEAKSQLEVSRRLREHGRALVANNVGPRPSPPSVAPPRVPEPTLAVTSVAAASVSPPRPAPHPARGCAANQVSVPGGTFWMGDPDLDKDSKPVHKVTLSPFCIDKTEVTVAAFRACVHAGDCAPPSATVDWKGIKREDKTRWSQFCTWGKSGLDQHPINCVDWKQATAYCEWTGGRLPTEAEWEYAARGNDGRQYPWGNEPPDAARLNACGSECASMLRERFHATWKPMYTDDDGWPATAPVGRYPRGASPFGVLDMAGNVWEWTADSFADYTDEAVTNPHRSRPDTSSRTLRGGSWHDNGPARVRAAVRNGNDPANRVNSLGFRCARGVTM